MIDKTIHLIVDGVSVSAHPDQTIIQACDKAGIYIPRLCHHPDLIPDGRCRLCICKVNGRESAACVTPVSEGMVVENNTAELNEQRKRLIEFLFVEGKHPCPYCVASGACELQAVGYFLGMVAPKDSYQETPIPIDATDEAVYLDRERCILCGRCVRASTSQDGKNIFAFTGRGIDMRISVDPNDTLHDSNISILDKAAHVCPVGCIVIKHKNYLVPEGQRLYDQHPISKTIEYEKEKTS